LLGAVDKQLSRLDLIHMTYTRDSYLHVRKNLITVSIVFEDRVDSGQFSGF